jgi:L-cystine uptake protein TcyP (sodium:dicarboxylate symporter family)
MASFLIFDYILPISDEETEDHLSSHRRIILYKKKLFSSFAALPLTLKCMEEKNKINKVISGFMLTVGTSVNVDGTTMFVEINLKWSKFILKKF